jgi:hypothetical protein
MDEVLNAVIVYESDRGEKERKEEEQAELIKGFAWLKGNAGAYKDYGNWCLRS